MRKLLVLIFVLFLIVFFFTKSVKAISPLHVEGKYIKDDAGCNVYLRGVGRWSFYYTPTGWFMSGTMWEDNVWDESVVRFQLQTIKSWGANHIRFHTVGEWWKQDNVTYKGYTGSYRNNLRRVIEIAGQEGLYVIVNHYSPISYQTAPNHGSAIPYAPYCGSDESPGATAAMQAVFPNKQSFVDYWANGVDGVADVLGDLPNVIFEIQNEPHALGMNDPVAVRDDFMDAQQQSITAIRNIANSQNLIMVTWGVGIIPHIGLGIYGTDMSWASAYSHKLNDPLNNLIYVAHLYRRPYHTDWAVDKDALRTQFESILVKEVSQEHPVIFGEMGVSMQYAGANLPEELTWARHTLEICNEWGVGYSAWVWEPMPYVDQDWWLYEDLTNIVPTAWGQVLIDAIAASGTTVCEGPITTTTTAILTTTTTTSPTTTTTTTTIPLGQVTISGQLRNTTDTIEADVSVYNQETGVTNTSQITSGGNYGIGLWPGVYDLQYSILEFFIPNFWIKLLSLNITSNLQDVVNYVTGYPSENKVSLTVNISTDQEIQVYSGEEPKKLSVNGTEMTKATTLPLSPNEWTYNSSEQKLYMIASPILPATTTSTTTPTTTTITTTTVSGTTSTTTIPGVYKTFGKTDLGANEAVLNENDIYGSKFTLPEDGSISKISIYITTGTWHQKIKFAIYDVSGGNPNNLKGASEEILSEVGWQWANATFNPPISLTAGDYYLFVWSTSSWYAFRYDTNGAHAYRNVGYNNFPDPFETPDGTGNYDISIYATYTSS